MNHKVVENKASRLFVFLGAFFVANALIAEFIGVKIFSLEKTLGIEALDISLFGIEHLSFNLTAGVLLWPFVFVLTDIINEYFGTKGVRMLSYIAAALISYAFVMFYFGIKIIPADFWVTTKTDSGIPDMNNAFAVVFGQGLWIIIGSLVAFLLGQLIDVTVFHWVKKITGEKYIWLRATGSTLVSQLIDSFVVLFIAFYIGAGWQLNLVFAIGIMNYIYKFSMALLMTPVIYAVHGIIEKFLGEELATQLKQEAMK
jgi:queuosine precursor transporter